MFILSFCIIPQFLLSSSQTQTPVEQGSLGIFRLHPTPTFHLSPPCFYRRMSYMDTSADSPHHPRPSFGLDNEEPQQHQEEEREWDQGACFLDFLHETALPPKTLTRSYRAFKAVQLSPSGFQEVSPPVPQALLLKLLPCASPSLLLYPYDSFISPAWFSIILLLKILLKLSKYAMCLQLELFDIPSLSQFSLPHPYMSPRIEWVLCSPLLYSYQRPYTWL